MSIPYNILLKAKTGNFWCVKGQDGKDVINGQDGKDGVDGQDGQDGEDGKNALVKITRFECNSICKSYRGAIISSGLDLNDNGILEKNEVTSSAFVCDSAR